MKYLSMKQTITITLGNSASALRKNPRYMSSARDTDVIDRP